MFSNSVYADSKWKIGSCFSREGDIATGLSRKEVQKYLPDFIGISPDEVGFAKGVRNFFADLTIDVPSEGLVLEIGVDEDGFPLAVLDFIKYRFAKANPKVVDQGKDKNPYLHLFEIVDPQEKLQQQSAHLKLKVEANKEFTKLIGNDIKFGHVCNVLLGSNKMSREELEIAMDKLIQDNPKSFLEVVQDKNLDTRSFILECVSYQVLRKAGTSYINGDDIIGGEMDEAIVYLKDPKNSDVVATLKARLAEFKKTR